MRSRPRRTTTTSSWPTSSKGCGAWRLATAGGHVPTVLRQHPRFLAPSRPGQTRAGCLSRHFGKHRHVSRAAVCRPRERVSLLSRAASRCVCRLAWRLCPRPSAPAPLTRLHHACPLPRLSQKHKDLLVSVNKDTQDSASLPALPCLAAAAAPLFPGTHSHPFSPRTLNTRIEK